MRIRFIGPISRVTGSCYHLVDDAKGAEYLVDFGLVQNEGGQIVDAEGGLPFDLSRIKQVFLTHAHLDHCGMIPYLYKLGYDGVVWCTRETAEIAKINLKDPASLNSMPYSKDDVDRVKWQEPKGVPLLGRLKPFDTDRFMCFFRTSHIAGAVSIGITWGPKDRGQRTIVFSGDLGPNDAGRETQALLRYRMDARDVDYAVCESTYGDSVRDTLSWEQRLEALFNALQGTIMSRGLAIVPAFAIGRSQDLIFDLAVLQAREPEALSDVDIVVDSPMGNRVSKVYAEALLRTDLIRGKNPKAMWLNSRLADWLGMDRTVEGENLLRELVSSVLTGDAPPVGIAERFPGSLAAKIDGRRIERPTGRWTPRDGAATVLIASGGMCSGGPVVEYLHKHLQFDSTTVVFPGYAAQGTLAYDLLRIRDVPVDERRRLSAEIKFPGSDDERRMAESDIRARIEKVAGYSGHADQQGLVDWLLPANTDVAVANTVFLSHGRDQARKALREHLLERDSSLTVEVPETWQGFYDLDLGAWCDRESKETEVHGLRRRIEDLEAKLALLDGRKSNPSLRRAS